jgi:hypothetical protein
MDRESRATAALALIACMCLVVTSCENVPVAPGLVEGPADGLAHHRPGHGGGGGGGEDPPAAGVILTMTGAVVTGPVSTTIDEKKRRLWVDIPSAQFAMVATNAAAVDEISNPSNPICEYRPASMPEDTKQALADELLANRGDGGFVVNKFEDKGQVVYNQSSDGRLWMSWGFNTQTDGQQAANVTYEGTDKQNADAIRNFELTGGVIRVLDPDIGDLVCSVQDTLLAVVEPEIP